MTFTRGNLALRESLNNGRRVFLFEAVSKGLVKFVSEVEYFDSDYFETKDTSNKLRTGIKFFFKRQGINLNLQPKDFKPVVVSDPGVNIYQPIDRIPNETERSGLVTSRVGQGAYRKRIIHRWEYQCAVTGFDKLNILIASHIVPWASANNEERLDVNNGILLSPNYDALFDRHLLSFEKDGSILLSDSISTEAYHKIGVTGLEKIKRLNSVNHEYLERHRIHLI